VQNSSLLRILFSEEKPAARGSAIFIDRDGVINCREPGGYVLNWSQFVFMPGIRAALKQLATLQLRMIVISNQAAIAKGLLDEAGLREITRQMRQTLLTDNVNLAAAYYCPHMPSDNCICRKPKPELLYRAASEFNVDLARSIFIGDSESDVRAARAAGCTPVLFGLGLQNFSDSKDWSAGVPTAVTADELFEVAEKCLGARN
jgi:D-glycero-D-manno-heptose 1,7-bisphosphate phosphatase